MGEEKRKESLEDYKKKLRRRLWLVVLPSLLIFIVTVVIFSISENSLLGTVMFTLVMLSAIPVAICEIIFLAMQMAEDEGSDGHGSPGP